MSGELVKAVKTNRIFLCVVVALSVPVGCLAGSGSEMLLSREIGAGTLAPKVGEAEARSGNEGGMPPLRQSQAVAGGGDGGSGSGYFQRRGEAADATDRPGQAALGRQRSAILTQLNGGSRIVPIREGARPYKRDRMAGEAVDLQGAVASSQAYSNEIAGAAARSDAAARFSDAAAGAAFLPRLDIQDKKGRETSTPSAITDPITGKKVPSDVHQMRDTVVQLTQPLLDVPAIYEYRRQRAVEMASIETLADSRERVTFQAVNAYLRLIEARIAQIITGEYEANLKQLLERIALRAAAGASSVTDSDRVRGRVVGAKASIIETQALLEAARVHFRRLTGLDPATVEIPDVLLPDMPSDIENALSQAFENNRELRAAMNDTEAVRLEQKSKLGRFLPRLEFHYTDVRIYNAGGIAANDPSIGSSPTQRDKRAMIVLNFNLLNGGSDLNQARGLAGKSEESRLRAAEIQRQLEERIYINFETLITVKDRIDAVREEVEVNEKVVAAFGEQLVLANRSLLDVLDAMQRLNDSKMLLNRLIVAEATASYQLLNNLGAIGTALSRTK